MLDQCNDGLHIATEDKTMSNALRLFVAEEQGQDLIEYALLCALLAVACIGGILELTRIVEFFTFVGAFLDGAI